MNRNSATAEKEGGILKTGTLFLAIILLAACCFEGNSPEYIIYYLNDAFKGRPANEFFASYGFPSARFQEVNGNTVYWWASTQLKTYPSQANPATYLSADGSYQIVGGYRGKDERQYCEIRIYASKEDIINGFDIAVDSTGKWSTSRCSEIFKRPLK